MLLLEKCELRWVRRVFAFVFSVYRWNIGCIWFLDSFSFTELIFCLCMALLEASTISKSSLMRAASLIKIGVFKKSLPEFTLMYYRSILEASKGGFCTSKKSAPSLWVDYCCYSVCWGNFLSRGYLASDKRRWLCSLSVELGWSASDCKNIYFPIEKGEFGFLRVFSCDALRLLFCYVVV